MNFSDPAKVGQVVDCMVQTDLLRAVNRALINGLFNGDPPYTATEADEGKFDVNVNFREACVLGHQARRQYEQAFLSTSNYFNVDVSRAPIHKRQDWSQFITKEINKTLKRSLPYTQLMRSKFAGVVLHGVGAQFWESRYDWKPRFVAIEDLMVPTDTDEDLENLPYFAIRRIYTPGELFRKTHGKHVDPGWNLKAVRNILDQYAELNTNQQAYNWLNNPEKMAELWKQNQAYYESDAAPSVTFWEFYYLEEDSDTPGWRRKMIIDRNGPSVVENQFVYDSGDRIVATELSEILHIQFGDLSNKPPFKYHSVRSLGFLLFDVCHLMNRLRCRFTQRVFEDLLTWFRVRDPNDRARLNQVALFDKGFVPDGLEFVKRDERYSVDVNLVGSLMANYRQLMSEASSTFTQDIDSGTQREVTATETMARVNQVNALLSSLLNLAYVQELFSYQEICRRFCIQDSEDPQVKRFLIKCQEKGIPKRFLVADNWDVTPETSLGSGNKILQVAQAKELMTIRPQLDPQEQRLLTHIFVEAVGDAKYADMLAPIKNPMANTPAKHDAELSFAAMMAGVAIQPLEGLNHIDQIETMLRLTFEQIKQIQATDNVGTPQQVRGLSLVIQNIEGQIQLLAEDEEQKDRARQYSELASEAQNDVKGFAQRQAQAAKAAAAQNGNGQVDPAVISKIRGDQITAEAKARATDAKTAQALAHKNAKFQQQQQLDAAKTAGEIGRENLKAHSEIMGGRAKTAAELHNDALLTAATVPAGSDEEA